MSLAEKFMDLMGYEEYDDDAAYEQPPVKPGRASHARVAYVEPTVPPMQVSLIKLREIEDARLAVEQVADGMVVIFSLADTPRALSRRLLDFVCGGLYAFDGYVEHIAIDTYLLLPQHIEILYD